MTKVFNSLLIWLFVLIMTLVISTTILPDYLPVDGSLDFIMVLLPLAVAFGGIVMVVRGMFSAKD